MKLSLKKIFTALLIVSVIFLFALGSLALLFNYQLAGNQKNILQASTIDTSRFTMSNALASFLSRQSIILSRQNQVEGAETSTLTLRKPIEERFVEGVTTLAPLAQSNPEITASLNVIQDTYKKFLESDEQLLTLSQVIVKVRDQLKEASESAAQEVTNIIRLSRNISGVLSLQNEKLMEKVENFATSKERTSDPEFLASVGELTSSTISNGQIISQQLNTDFMTLTTLMQRLTQESNPDRLNDLKGNEIVQHVDLIRQDLDDLEKQLQSSPELSPILKIISEKFDAIVARLIEEPRNMFELRQEFNNKLITQDETINQIQQYLVDIDGQFRKLSDISTQIRTTLVNEAKNLMYKYKIIIIGMDEVFLIFMVSVGYFLQQAIANVLNLLTTVMRKMAYEEGGLKTRLKETNYEDLNEVVGSFNVMATNLDQSQAHLHALYRSSERFVPKAFLKLLNKESIEDIKLGDCAETTITVLFTDIRGYTTIAEKMNPKETYAFINGYFKYVAPIIRNHQGFISQYEGDGIMALFPHQADDGVRAVLEMEKALVAFNAEQPRDQQIHVGYGLNTGPAVLGTVGEEERLGANVISDAINLASRVEGLNKYYGTEFLISDTTYNALTQPKEYGVRLIDKVKVKGKVNAIYLYEIIAEEAMDKQQQAFLKTFEEAFDAYQNSDFVAALSGFKVCQSMKPKDQPSDIFIKRCQVFLEEGTPKDWNGTFVMKEK